MILKDCAYLYSFWIKTANNVKYFRRHVDEINVDINIKLPFLLLYALYRSNIDFSLKLCFHI